MAVIPRKTQQVFGYLLSAPGNIAVFGSLADGSPAYSKDLAVIQNTNWTNGLVAALINAPDGLASPALEDFNAIFFVLTTQLAYLLQNGIAEWDAGTDYQTDSFCKVGHVVYVSKVDNNTNHAVSDTNFWQTYSSTLNNSRGICKAWVNFRGSDGSILDSFNVSGVSRTAVGCYEISFQTTMVNANYVFSGSVGVAPGGAYSNGDDNVITGGAPGKLSTKTVAGFTVFCYDRGDSATQDGDSISVMVFGA